MTTNKRTFVYAEGREYISPFMADDMKRATLDYGWTFRQLFSIDPNDIFDDTKMYHLFPPNSAVILRNLPKNNPTEIAMLTEWLDSHHIVSLNFHATGGLEASNDKRFQSIMLKSRPHTSEFVIPTYEVGSKKTVLDLLTSKKISYPFLLKPSDGSIGKGIRIIKQESDLDSQKRWSNMMAQQFIDSDYDWRVYTVGNQAVGALRRGGKDQKPHDFHAYANGITKSKETDPDVLDAINSIAVGIAKVAGLEYSGCDIIRDKKTGKYYVLEINTSATWEGRYNEIIGVDLATEILKWCDQEITRGLGN
ncbi:hypothetical protein IJG28_01400 [Candidatus Saccharibacteria bacterium]|nr:hypothetical protein [Candidatus Saccharibacteria bacterium]